MILHFSQIGLTDDLTFTVILLSVIVRPPKDTQRAVCCILQSSNAGLQVHLSNSLSSLCLGSQLQKGRSILMPQQSSLEHYNTYFYRLQADLCLNFLVFTGFSGIWRQPGKGSLQRECRGMRREETEDGWEDGTEARVRKFCSSEVTKFSHLCLLPLLCCPLSAEHRIFCRRVLLNRFSWVFLPICSAGPPFPISLFFLPPRKTEGMSRKAEERCGFCDFAGTKSAPFFCRTTIPSVSFLYLYLSLQIMRPLERS